MNRASLLFAGVLLFAGAARAQSPEDEWGTYQGPPTTPPPAPAPVPPPLPPPGAPPPLVAPAPYYGPPSAPVRPRPEVLARARLNEERNEVSMFGAPSLGAGKRGQSVSLGFPLLSLRLLFGLTDWLDLGVGYDTYYFLMHEPRLVARFGLVRGANWSLAASLEGGYAFFTQRASRESRGSRWITGRRNINVSPALHLAYQGNSPRAARIFFEGRYMLSLDTEPYATDPLVGVPPAVVLGHNGSLKGGAELPLSPRTAFMFAFGFDLHGRPEDAVAMPVASVGLVTSL